jgi:RNase adaptor protein for sRNA GlmZ degradation
MIVYDFLLLGFKPVIVVDTFSGDKIFKYIDDIHLLNKELKIQIFGLYTTDEELKKRIESRKKGEFKEVNICLQINEDLKRIKCEEEFQIDTTGLSPMETKEIIKNQLNKNTNHK